jgi:CheY-like chemotaxis protein
MRIFEANCVLTWKALAPWKRRNNGTEPKAGEFFARRLFMGMKVMTVDDSAAIRKVIKHCLEILDRAPEEFYQAANGEEGLAQLEKNPVDLVFLDLNMPGMNGFEFIKRIQDHPRRGKFDIVVVSSETSQTRIAELERQNLYFIHKPFTPEDMEVVLKKMEASQPKSPVADEAIQKVMREVFNIMTFTAMEIPAQETSEVSEIMQAQMDFTGPICGRMTLRLPVAILPDLTRNMLGEDEASQVEEQDQKDVLGELLNVICGNLLNVQAGLEKTFDLGIPQISRVIGAAAASRLENGYRLCFSRGWAELAVATK